MNKQTIINCFKGVSASAKKHSPEILLAIGIASGITAAVLAVKATPKALLMIDNEIDRQNYDVLEKSEPITELKPIDVVKVAWKPYVPAVATGVFSIACLISANSVHSKRNAALATAYQLSTTAFNEYRGKVIETIGDEKEKVIHDKIAKERVEKNPPNDSTIIITGKGKTLCYDAYSDRYFESDIDKIKRAMNDLNYRMISGMEMYISLNEFRTAIGLPQIPIGEEVGWRIDKGQIDIHFSSQITEDDRPAIVIEFLIPPEYGFKNLY